MSWGIRMKRLLLQSNLLHALPWLAGVVAGVLLLERAPLWVRVAGIGLVLLVGAAGWCLRRFWGHVWLPAGITAAWVALGSFPATVSLFPMTPIYLLLVLGIGVGGLFRLPPGKRGAARFYVLVLSVWVVSTPPARRYAVSAKHPALRAVVQELDSPSAAVRWVHEEIRREKGPPTDSAVDTLRRGYAHCGGMSNLLHKLLVEMGYPAEIVHAVGGDGRTIHTLVELPLGGVPHLADAQENVLLPVAAAELAGAGDRLDWPPPWRNLRTVYRYVPARGYVEIARAAHD